MFVERVLNGEERRRHVLGYWDKEHEWYCERFLKPEILRGHLAGMPLELMEASLLKYSEAMREKGFEYGFLREALKIAIDAWIGDNHGKASGN